MGARKAGEELEEELSKRVVATLSPAVGADNLRASVNVEYDLSTSEESQDKYDPAVSAVLTSQKSSEQIGTGADAGGVAGASANTPTANGTGKADAQTTTSDGGSQTSTSSDNSTFGVNKSRSAHRIARRPRQAASPPRSSSTTSSTTSWSPESTGPTSPASDPSAQLKQLQDLAQAVLGAWTRSGETSSASLKTSPSTTAARPRRATHHARQSSSRARH